MLQIILFSLLAIVIGAALILYGYRIFLVLLPVFGFFAGFWVGASAMQWTLNENFLATLFSIIVGIVLGIIFAIASFFIYFLGTDVLPFTPVQQAFIIFGLIGIPVSALIKIINPLPVGKPLSRLSWKPEAILMAKLSMPAI